MALSWRIGTCHTQHRCGPCSSALAPQARSAASAHVRQPRGCALLWIARSQASTLRGARSVCSAAVEAEAAVAAAPVERERLLDGSSPKDSDSAAPAPHTAEEHASTSLHTDAAEAGSDNTAGATQAVSSSTIVPPAPVGSRRTTRKQSDQQSRIGEGTGKRAHSGRLRRGRPQAKERCSEPFFQLGDTVVARILWANEKGARAELLKDRRIVGYLPVRELPYVARKDVGDADTGHWGSGACIPVGLVREYEVVAIPDDMEYHGRGPMLSARRIDLNLLWRRAQQLLEASTQDREVVRVRIADANSGGLLTTCESLPAFIPYSHVPKSAKMSANEMSAEYKGKEVVASVAEVVPLHRKLMLSIINGEQNLELRKLHVGALVWGTVRRVEPFGLFLGLDKLRMSALLHISNMSRAHVSDPEGLFTVGDRVRAIVVGMNPDCTRISVSTAELEPADGDMLEDKEKVYAAAEEQQKAFIKHLEEVEAEASQQGAALEW